MAMTDKDYIKNDKDLDEMLEEDIANVEALKNLDRGSPEYSEVVGKAAEREGQIYCYAVLVIYFFSEDEKGKRRHMNLYLKAEEIVRSFTGCAPVMVPCRERKYAENAASLSDALELFREAYGKYTEMHGAALAASGTDDYYTYSAEEEIMRERAYYAARKASSLAWHNGKAEIDGETMKNMATVMTDFENCMEIA